MDASDTKYIGVIGSGATDYKMDKLAFKVGEEIARQGAILVCGGLSGVMRASCEGAKSQNGTTIGILPGDKKDHANEFVDIAIPTGIGEARNMVIIRTVDSVIALPGKFGTLSEMAFCMKMNKPLVSLSDWKISEDIKQFDDPVLAVKRAIELAGKR